MSTVSFNGLLIISLIAVAAPILAASVKRVKLRTRCLFCRPSRAGQ